MGDQTSGPTQMETTSLAFLLAVGSLDLVKLKMQFLSCLRSSCPFCFCPAPANTFLFKGTSSVTPNNLCQLDLACFPVSPFSSKGMASNV